MASVTQLSVPPLARPTAKGLSVVRGPSSIVVRLSLIDTEKGLSLSTYCLLRAAFCPSDPAGIRVPDELVELQSHTHFQAIPKDPFGQLARGESAEDRREDHFVHSAAEVVPLHKIPGVPVIILVEDDELHLVFALEDAQVVKTELLTLTAPRTLHIHHFDHGPGKVADVPLSAGLDEDAVALGEKLRAERVNFLLKERLAARQFHQFPAELSHPANDFFDRHSLPPVKRVGSEIGRAHV